MASHIDLISLSLCHLYDFCNAKVQALWNLQLSLNDDEQSLKTSTTQESVELVTARDESSKEIRKESVEPRKLRCVVVGGFQKSVYLINYDLLIWIRFLFYRVIYYTV